MPAENFNGVLFAGQKGILSTWETTQEGQDTVQVP